MYSIFIAIWLSISSYHFVGTVTTVWYQRCSGTIFWGTNGNVFIHEKIPVKVFILYFAVVCNLFCVFCAHNSNLTITFMTHAKKIPLLHVLVLSKHTWRGKRKLTKYIKGSIIFFVIIILQPSEMYSSVLLL